MVENASFTVRQSQLVDEGMASGQWGFRSELIFFKARSDQSIDHDDYVDYRKTH